MRFGFGLILLVLVPAAAWALPPEVLYHFGNPSVLLQNAAANTVPKEAWDTYIMGEKSNYELNPFRRGLYGTIHPAFAEIFGPWFMAIRIRPECRTAQAVVIPSDLSHDPRFTLWYTGATIQEFQSLHAYVKACFRMGESRLIAKVKNLESTHGKCERVLNRFYVETGVKIVLDEQWMDQDDLEINLREQLSWYIRDRSCITGIETSARNVVGVFARIPELWAFEPLASIHESGTDVAAFLADKSRWIYTTRALAAFHMLAWSMSEAPDAARAEDLQTIRAEAQGAQTIWLRAPEREYSPSRSVPQLIDLFERCQAHGRIRDFQAAARAFLDGADALSDKIRDDYTRVMKSADAAAAFFRKSEGLCR